MQPHGGMGGPPPGMGGMQPHGGMGGPPPGMGGPAPQKTMMLQDSEGISSLANRGPLMPAEVPSSGASGMFWVISIMVGVAIGALGYIVVLQL
jgi:hypothetical protein